MAAVCVGVLAAPSAARAQRDQYVLLRMYVPQVADGGGWRTTITITNFRESPHAGVLSFFDSQGQPLQLGSGIGSSQVNVALNPKGTYVYSTLGSGANVRVGYATYLTKVGGVPLIISTFRNQLPNLPSFDAAVEGLLPISQRLAFYFDNTQGSNTGIALVNPDSTAGDFTVSFHDEQGNRFAFQALSLPALHHTAFVLSERFPETAGRRGMAQVERILRPGQQVTTEPYQALTVLQFTPGGDFSAVPRRNPQ